MHKVKLQLICMCYNAVNPYAVILLKKRAAFVEHFITSFVYLSYISKEMFDTFVIIYWSDVTAYILFCD